MAEVGMHSQRSVRSKLTHGPPTQRSVSTRTLTQNQLDNAVTMSLSRAIDHDVSTRVRRISTELEFLGEPNLRNAECVNERIEAVRLELEDAQRATRTLLAMVRLSLEELE